MYFGWNRHIGPRALPIVRTALFSKAKAMATSLVLQGGSCIALPQRAVAKALSDQILIERIATGDQLAMRTLFARHHTHLYRFLVRIVRDMTLAEDLTSDVFLDVWFQAGRFEARASVSTWLISIGRFKALSALRRRADVELDDEMGSTIPDPADDPEIALQKKYSGDVLRKCVAALPRAQSQMIDLVYYHEKSVTEAAQIVGISEATAKTRMFYARRKLANLVLAA
jgi:RNA polymerase sigma-70 factor (ECF subfamily)